MSALLLGALASSSLLLGGTVAYDLVEDAFEQADGPTLFTGLAAGAFVFYLGDLLIDRRGGDHRKRSTGAQAAGSGAAIALGTVLDGVPESVVLGTSLVAGLGWTFVVAIFISNLPEAMSATAGLALLVMLADTMIPEAYEFGGKATGLLTALGFSLAFGVSAMGG